LLRLGSLRSVYGMVAKYIRDERLRTVLSFHPLLVGGNPFAASSIYSLICFLERRWGVHFAMGGTGKLVDGLVGLIRGQGNAVHCNSEVSEILVRDGAANGVRLADGSTLHADIVVSNACSAHTYKNMLPARHRKHWTDKRIARGRYSMSLFVWYFGTKRQYTHVAHHTILLGPRYRELLRDIFDRHHLAEDFSLYLHRPTATDPSLAPDGHDAFYVLSPVPHLASGTDWPAFAETYRTSIETFLSRTLLPDLAENIVTSRLMTPLDFSERLLSYQGAAFGLEPLLTQSAWFRPHNESEDIKHLYLVGAGTHPGAGLPGVISSARVLDRVVPDAKIFA
jgi:phytoene desaturase